MSCSCQPDAVMEKAVQCAHNVGAYRCENKTRHPSMHCHVHRRWVDWGKWGIGPCFTWEHDYKRQRPKAGVSG